jgi:hypothetical protein
MISLDGTSLFFLRVIYSLIWDSIRIIILLRIVYRLGKKDFFLVAILALAIINEKHTGNSDTAMVVWLICGAKSIDMKKIVKTLFRSNFVGVALVLVLVAVGIIENSTYTRGSGLVRYSMGFYHPNTFSAYMFQLEALYMLYKSDKIKILDSFIILIVTIWVHLVTDSNTAFILMICLFVLSFAISIKKLNVRYIKSMYEFWVDKLKYIGIIMPFFVFLLTFTYNEGTGIFKGTLLARVTQAAIYFKIYRINLLGHAIELNYNMNNTNLETLDNAYIYLLLTSGIIIFLLYIYSNIRLIVNSAKEQNYIFLSILVLYSIYGFSETYMVRFPLNFTLIFLTQIIWKKHYWDREV